MEEVSSEDVPKTGCCYTSFELVEHLTDPRDIFVFTTLSGQGLDILVLWEKSKAVHPPHYINFFNLDSVSTLVEDVGFEVLDTLTPGKLDVDILKNNSSDIRDRFWKYFIENAEEKSQKLMQNFVRENKLSSHMMHVIQK